MFTAQSIHFFVLCLSYFICIVLVFMMILCLSMMAIDVVRRQNAFADTCWFFYSLVPMCPSGNSPYYSPQYLCSTSNTAASALPIDKPLHTHTQNETRIENKLDFLFRLEWIYETIIWWTKKNLFSCTKFTMCE